MAKQNGKKPSHHKNSNATVQWAAFTKELEGLLGKINTEKVAAQSQDSKDLESFMQSEANLFSKAIQFGGPLPFHKNPDWEKILSTKPPYGKFGVIIKDTLSTRTLTEDDALIRNHTLMLVIKQAFHDAYANFKEYTLSGGTAAKTKVPNSQEDFIQIIGDAIIALEKDIDSEVLKEIFNKLSDFVLIGNNHKQWGDDFTKSPWSKFEGKPPTPPVTPPTTPSTTNAEDDTASQPSPVDQLYQAFSGTAPGIWPGTDTQISKYVKGRSKPAYQVSFCYMIAEVLVGKSDHAEQIEEETQKILNILSQNLKKYEAYNEASVRNWVQTTLLNLPSSLLSLIKTAGVDALITNLENEITSIFPQPDKSYFYDHLQVFLKQSIYNPPIEQIDRLLHSQEGQLFHETEELLRAELRKGNPINATTIANLQTEIGARNASITNLESEELLYNRSLVGIKKLVEEFMDKNFYSDPTTSSKSKHKLVGELLRSIEGAVEEGINSTFSRLINQGSQGDLMNATYERQTVTRIVDYTTSLLAEMKKDLDKEIPANRAASLSAAKDVTAAAVSFRQFAESLEDVVSKFTDEGDRQKSPTNYHDVENQIMGNSPSLPGFDKIADTLYSGGGTDPNEPKVKSAEYNGVQLAAISAGLGVSMQTLMMGGGAQKEALTALNKLKSSASGEFQKKYNVYNSDAEAYFTTMADYIQDRQNFAFDQATRNMLQDAMDQMTNLIVDSSSTS